jgi:hypothetical protein
MIKYFKTYALILVCLCISLTADAITQSKVTPQWYISKDVVIHTPTKEVTLRAGTMVVVEIPQNYSSKNLSSGNTINIRAKFNVVVDKITVIAAGVSGFASVTDVKKAGMFGRAGRIELQVQSIQAVDGQQVPLSGIPLTLEGENRALLAWGLAIGLAIFTIGIGLVAGIFIKGKEAEAKAGMTINSNVAADIQVGERKN